jgi:hypothetical protein
VLNYNVNTRELTIGAARSYVPIKLLVPINTPVEHAEQSALSLAQSGPSDLVKVL